jgi:hypothetical protein
MVYFRRTSDARRMALATEISVPVVSSFFPLERYYDAAEKLYLSVTQTAFTGEKDLDLCYVYGKRYCMFCIEAIPMHIHYGAVKYKSLQNKHTAQVQKVLSMMEDVAAAMDNEEVERGAVLPFIDKSCGICLEDYTHGDCVIRNSSKECEHMFHRACIVDWLSSENANHGHCPMCRQTYTMAEKVTEECK